MAIDAHPSKLLDRQNTIPCKQRHDLYTRANNGPCPYNDLKFQRSERIPRQETDWCNHLLLIASFLCDLHLGEYVGGRSGWKKVGYCRSCLILNKRFASTNVQRCCSRIIKAFFRSDNRHLHCQLNMDAKFPGKNFLEVFRSGNSQKINYCRQAWSSRT